MTTSPRPDEDRDDTGADAELADTGADAVLAETVTDVGTEGGDYRSKPRRRGDELRDAIYRAALDELTQNGYADLTMDRVAARAKASKGSLYRRWPGRAELVVDAIRHTQGSYPIPPDSGDLRAELTAVLTSIAESLEGPRGEAVRGLVTEVFRHPELMRTVRTEIMDSSLRAMLEVLRRGVVRHEVRPAALAPMVARVGPGLVRQQMMIYGELNEPGFIEQVVDQVVLPLVLARPGEAGAANGGPAGR
jgi:AcrR family transcriptional regulator